MNKVSSTIVSSRPRMSLANAQSGRIQQPYRVLAYGAEGVGKSTFAAGAPAPVFLGVDNRTGHLDVMRLRPTSFDEIVDCLEAIARDRRDRETVVLDPVNWMEPMVFHKVTGGGVHIDKWDGGYGRGQSAAIDQWRIILSHLEALWLGGMNVILLAHSAVKTFNDPEGPPYDRHEIAMNARSAGLLRAWVDYVLFMRYEAYASKLDGKAAKLRGISTGVRVIHTAWTAAYDAKRSYPIPDELPLAWSSFVEAVEGTRAQLDTHRKEIARLIEEIADVDVTRRATADVAAAGDDAGRLAVIANALAARANQIRTEHDTKGEPS